RGRARAAAAGARRLRARAPGAEVRGESHTARARCTTADRHGGARAHLPLAARLERSAPEVLGASSRHKADSAPAPWSAAGARGIGRAATECSGDHRFIRATYTARYLDRLACHGRDGLHGAWRGRHATGRRVGSPFTERPWWLYALAGGVYLLLMMRLWRPLPVLLTPPARAAA